MQQGCPVKEVIPSQAALISGRYMLELPGPAHAGFFHGRKKIPAEAGFKETKRWSKMVLVAGGCCRLRAGIETGVSRERR